MHKSSNMNGWNFNLNMTLNLEAKNETTRQPERLMETECVDETAVSIKVVVTSTVLAALNCIIVGGNLLVILAVLVNSKLRKCYTNHFVLSLAVSDLLLGLAVLPFSSVTLTLDKQWVFGPTYCTIWLATDVWLCTASILNLVAISFERFLAIRNPIGYAKLLTPVRVHFVVVAIWILAFLICLPSLFQNMNSTVEEVEEVSLKDLDLPLRATQHNDSLLLNTAPNKSDWPALRTAPAPRLNATHSNKTHWVPSVEPATSTSTSTCAQRNREECTIAESSTLYVLYSFCFSFLIPAICMIFMYTKIYVTAKSAMRNIQTGQIIAKGLKQGEKVTMRVHFGKRDSAVGMLALSAIGGVARQALRTADKNLLKAGCHSSREKVPTQRVHKLSITQTTTSCSTVNASCGTPENECDKTQDVHELLAQSRNAASRWHTVSSLGDSGVRVETHREQLHKMEQLEELYKKNYMAHAGRKPPKNRETKAAKVCFILVFGFLVMWMPFFVAYVITPFCTDCIPAAVWDAFFFLGYLNSAVNVVIYAAFSRDFRTAFVGLLTGRVLSERKRRQEQVRVQFATRTLIDASMRLHGDTLDMASKATKRLQNHVPCNTPSLMSFA